MCGRCSKKNGNPARTQRRVDALYDSARIGDEAQHPAAPRRIGVANTELVFDKVEFAGGELSEPAHSGALLEGIEKTRRTLQCPHAPAAADDFGRSSAA